MAPDPNLLSYWAIRPGSPEATTLRLIVDVARQMVGADEGSLLVLDEAARELVFAMTTGSASSEAALIGQRVPLGKGITGLAVHTQQVQIGAPTFKDIKQTEAITSEGGPQAVIAAPLVAGDRTVGAVTAVSFSPDKRFTSADADIFERLGALGGVLIDQRQRLDAFEHLASGGEMPGDVSDPERRLIQAVGAVARLRPDRVRLVADLMSTIEAIIRPH